MLAKKVLSLCPVALPFSMRRRSRAILSIRNWQDRRGAGSVTGRYRSPSISLEPEATTLEIIRTWDFTSQLPWRFDLPFQVLGDFEIPGGGVGLERILDGFDSWVAIEGFVALVHG